MESETKISNAVNVHSCRRVTVGFGEHRSKVHNNLFCEFCDKTFFGKKLFDKHMMKHDDANYYKCDQCPYAGKRKLSLYQHKKLKRA
jgi:hypothetical protein